MAADGVQPIHGVSKFPGHRASDYPQLATDQARFVGEAVAVCLAETRAGAEDLAAQTGLSFDPLPAVVDMLEAVDKPPALVHDDWDDNVILDSRFEENVDGLQRRRVGHLYLPYESAGRQPAGRAWFSPMGSETNAWLSTASQIRTSERIMQCLSCGKTRCM